MEVQAGKGDREGVWVGMHIGILGGGGGGLSLVVWMSCVADDALGGI